MSKKQLTINYEASHYDMLEASDFKTLVDTGIAFAENAYAPYSNFKVSAVLQLEDGTIVKGANVENASYPVSICAERTLLSHTVSNYPNKRIKNLVVYVDKDLGKPVPPCGLCRQTLVEVETRQQSPIRLSMVAKNGQIITVNSCLDLLPWSFDGTYLE